MIEYMRRIPYIMWRTPDNLTFSMELVINDEFDERNYKVRAWWRGGVRDMLTLRYAGHRYYVYYN